MTDASGAAHDTVAETLFIVTVPGATPSKWVERFTSRHRAVQLVNQDEAAQVAHLRPAAEGELPRGIPQLGYVRWRLDASSSEVLTAAGIEPEQVHVVTLYQEQPVVCVGRDHVLAAWAPDVDGPLPAAELEALDDAEVDPRDFAPVVAPDADPLDVPEQPGAGERMALEIVASGAGYTVLPASVARMFGRRDLVTLPLEPSAAHPGWQVALAWRRDLDSELVQDFIGVARGRRPSSSRSSAVPEQRQQTQEKPSKKQPAPKTGKKGAKSAKTTAKKGARGRRR
ncbi:LysR substrate-binding domain-containing protein [Citricoccus muralis]|uniref:LysR substrate-binding domain-containing protein n=1 Tax=Citricoccus muralis TaxID=169134 RepID=A0ABY8H6C9_9MICC|nr:LysR substrate-binding domain-containing protein [Citricoccus muralis]WFP16689.1 LysR substrate-binding domain-containing protein [Citricoccus muralis]